MQELAVKPQQGSTLQPRRVTSCQVYELTSSRCASEAHPESVIPPMTSSLLQEVQLTPTALYLAPILSSLISLQPFTASYFQMSSSRYSPALPPYTQKLYCRATSTKLSRGGTGQDSWCHLLLFREYFTMKCSPPSRYRLFAIKHSRWVPGLASASASRDQVLIMLFYDPFQSINKTHKSQLDCMACSSILQLPLTCSSSRSLLLCSRRQLHSIIACACASSTRNSFQLALRLLRELLSSIAVTSFTRPCCIYLNCPWTYYFSYVSAWIVRFTDLIALISSCRWRAMCRLVTSSSLCFCIWSVHNRSCLALAFSNRQATFISQRAYSQVQQLLVKTASSSSDRISFLAWFLLLFRPSSKGASEMSSPKSQEKSSWASSQENSTNFQLFYITAQTCFYFLLTFIRYLAVFVADLSLSRKQAMSPTMIKMTVSIISPLLLRQIAQPTSTRHSTEACALLPVAFRLVVLCYILSAQSSADQEGCLMSRCSRSSSLRRCAYTSFLCYQSTLTSMARPLMSLLNSSGIPNQTTNNLYQQSGDDKAV